MCNEAPKLVGIRSSKPSGKDFPASTVVRKKTFIKTQLTYNFFY